MTRFAPLLSLITVLAASCTTSPRYAASVGSPSCCTTNPETALAFTDRSLYQLDSAWTNDLSQPFQLGALRGRVQVVAMFFASCTYACPIIVHDLQRIEAALPRDVRDKVVFTLITIDTERDTVDALHAYRAARKLPADRWVLLRGSPDDTLELAALLGVKFKREASGQFAHSNLITVLNREGEILQQLAGLNQDVTEMVKRITAALAEKASTDSAHE